MGIRAEVKKVENMSEIVGAGVMLTPGLMELHPIHGWATPWTFSFTIP